MGTQSERKYVASAAHPSRSGLYTHANDKKNQVPPYPLPSNSFLSYRAGNTWYYVWFLFKTAHSVVFSFDVCIPHIPDGFVVLWILRNMKMSSPRDYYAEDEEMNMNYDDLLHQWALYDYMSSLRKNNMMKNQWRRLMMMKNRWR